MKNEYSNHESSENQTSKNESMKNRSSGKKSMQNRSLKNGFPRYHVFQGNEKTPERRRFLTYIPGIVLFLVFLVLTVLAYVQDERNNLFLLTGLMAGAAAGLLAVFPFRVRRFAAVLAGLIIPVLVFCAVETYTHAPYIHTPDSFSPRMFGLNTAFFLILDLLLTFVLGSMQAGYTTGTAAVMVFGLGNAFVVRFRGHPIVPWDLLSLNTAASVAGNYTFELTWRLVFVTMIFAGILILCVKMDLKVRKPAIRIPAAAAAAVAAFLYVSQLQLPEVQSWFGMDTTLFTLNVLYRNNGLAAGFIGNLRFLHIQEPDGYSVEKLEELLQERTSGETQTESTGENSAKAENGGTASDGKEPKENPNVIVILNEAFSDLSVYGSFNTSQEVMPFFNSLQDEAVGGYVSVSVKGGNTANSEFELLTGDTMAFLPAGSVAYQQYVNAVTPSLASELKSLGYHTAAVHPYRRSGWDREKVYEYFGFDEFIDQTSFVNPVKYRNYISDWSAFEKLIELYEEKDPDEKLFAYEVTMQNHGGYSRNNPGFDIYLKLPDIQDKTTSVMATEKYLTLMNLSDQALEMLVSYFREQEEPTIILMLGDHQPSDYITNVVRRITGNAEDESMEDMQTGYQVPFVLWSNYGLEHKYYEKISVNYLQSLLLENAGLPLPAYQSFLKDLYAEYPVINANCIMDKEGNYTETGGTYPEDIVTYEMLQYNHLLDAKNRAEGWFNINMR